MTALWLRRYAEFIARHAWAVLVASTVASAIIAAGMSRLAVVLDPDQELPPDHPYVVADRAIRKEFGGTNFVAIALVPKSGDIWQPDVLRAVHDLTLDVLNASGVIRQNVVSLSSPYVRIPEDQGGILVSDYLMKDVPTDAAAAAALRARYHQEPLFKGTVVSDDERAALVLADFYDESTGGMIAATVDSVVSKYRSPTIDIAVTGSPIFGNAEAMLVGEQGKYFAGTIVAVFVVLWLAFGQLQGVILPSATALLSTALTLGVMGFAGIPINAWTSAVPLMVVTVAAGHSAQMLKRYYEEFARLGDRTAAVVASTERIGMVMMAAGATAGCGFAALSLLGIPTLAQFGIGVACGIGAAVMLEMSFMLALRVVWPAGRSARSEGPLPQWIGRVLVPLESAVRATPLAVVLAFVLVALVAVAGYPRLMTEVNTQQYWSERTQAGHDLRVFQKHFPSTTTFTVLLEGDADVIQTPEAIELMTGLQDAMAQVPGVGRTSSVADIIRRTYEVFAPEDAHRGLPSDAALIRQLFFLAQSPGFERFVDRSFSRSVVQGFLDREDSALTRAVVARLEGYLAEHPPQRIRVKLAGGVGPTLLALNDYTVHGKVLNIAVVFTVIFCIASLLLRTWLGGAFVTAPLVMALVVNLGVFSWLRIAFDLSGASIAAVGVGIGADYAIYCLYRLREEFRRSGVIEPALAAMMATTGRAVVFVALAISAGFGVYLLSDFYAFRILGLFVPLTMLISCVTALALPTALVLLLRPRFIFGAQRKP
ncbi:MAG TPA: MMPL family transporter [Candidatus Binatia bacterium]|nr:MMPL family transporter [Candidatus Binatia bacterium]